MSQEGSESSLRYEYTGTQLVAVLRERLDNVKKSLECEERCLAIREEYPAVVKNPGAAEYAKAQCEGLQRRIAGLVLSRMYQLTESELAVLEGTGGLHCY